MIDLTKVQEGDVVYLFRPNKGSYHKGLVKTKKINITVLYEGTKTKIVRGLFDTEIRYFRQEPFSHMRYKRFGDNEYVFRTKLEMCVFLDKYAKEKCNNSLLDEIASYKRKESMYFI